MYLRERKRWVHGKSWREEREGVNYVIMGKTHNYILISKN